ncbi:MAG: ATP-dependent zinc metalloprotease FtsH [Bacillota bacterium]
MNKNFRTASFYLLIILIALSLINYFSSQGTGPTDLEYKVFRQKLEAGQVEKVVQVGQKVSGDLKDGTKFASFIPSGSDPELSKLLLEKTSSYKVEPPPEPPWWTSILTYLFMFVLFVGVWFFFMQQTQSGGNRVMSFGKSRAKLHTEEKKRITFKDVAGYEEVKEELEEIVEFLKHPKKFIEMGARIPKGVLLYGPPGTGKTWMARAVAGEAGVPFFSISGSDFVEMFVGVGASRVRDLFETAKKNSPCIVFIDEIDAVGRQRGAGLGGGHDEREQTLNQLLVEMDGFDVNEGIIIMAATNRPDILDPALQRPGRFDRQVMVERPDVREREAVLRVHAKGKPLAEDVNLQVLAKSTPGFTPADLENLVNEAALLAARRGQKVIEMVDLEEAINRVMAGPAKKSRVISAGERRVSAYHEAGHALVAHLLPGFDPVHMVTIVPRGMAGGFTAVLPTEDRYYTTRRDILNMITYALGGRVAESIALNEISTGAQNDLERSTEMARRMVVEYGMSDELGPLTFGRKQEQVFLGRDITHDRNYSEEIAYAIDKEMRRIVESCYQQAQELLAQHRDKLDKLAQALLERETIKGDELEAIFAAS